MNGPGSLCGASPCFSPPPPPGAFSWPFSPELQGSSFASVTSFLSPFLLQLTSTSVTLYINFLLKKKKERMRSSAPLQMRRKLPRWQTRGKPQQRWGGIWRWRSCRCSGPFQSYRHSLTQGGTRTQRRQRPGTQTCPATQAGGGGTYISLTGLSVST